MTPDQLRKLCARAADLLRYPSKYRHTQHTELMEELEAAGRGNHIAEPSKMVEPTPAMIEAGAQRLVAWEDGSAWPDSWDALTVAVARHYAERVLRAALNVESNGGPTDGE